MGLNHKVRPNKCCVQKKQPRKNCEDNVMGENPGDPRFSNDFLDTPKAQSMEEKFDKLGFIKVTKISETPGENISKTTHI